jgi:hypothetical protein
METSQYTTNNVPNGYFKYQNNGHSSIVRIMEIAGKRMASFLNGDLPVALKALPEDAKFVNSAGDDGLKLTSEEIKGREEELSLYLFEELQNDPNLIITRAGRSLHISRADGNKRYGFRLDFNLVMVETDEDEKDNTDAE